MMDCQMLKERLLTGLRDWTEVRPLNDGGCLVVLPFWDDSGDPITVCVSTNEGRTVIDDGGSVAGLLFSLGQHDETTPAFKLLESLQRTHGLELDFGEGLVKLSVDEGDIYDGIAEMAKVVMAVHTVAPHIRVNRRSTRSFGPRLRSKITQRYRQMQVLDLVERRHRIDGAKVEGWPIDFRWSIGSNGQSKSVHVVAADLGVVEPLDKAQKVVALSLDTRVQRRREQGQLRVVFETRAGSSASAEAGEFLRFHGHELAYEVFDWGITDESSNFFTMAANELMSQAGEPWGSAMARRC